MCIAEAGAIKDGFGRFLSYPTFYLSKVTVEIGGRQSDLRPGPAVVDDFPSITGRAGFVNNDSGGRSLPCGFFVFIGPTTVVGHRVAVKDSGVLCRIARVIYQDDDRLVGHIDIGIVVPVSLRCNYAVTNKNKIAALYGDERHLLLGTDDLLISV